MELEVANRAPWNSFIEDKEVLINEWFLFSIDEFYDPDEDILDYEASLVNSESLPTWL